MTNASLRSEYKPLMKIETRQSGEQLILRVEGRLAGAYVPELERCWHSASGDCEAGKVAVDLGGITCVDRAGRHLLRCMHRSGVRFLGARLAMQDVVDEISERRDCTREWKL